MAPALARSARLAAAARRCRSLPFGGSRVGLWIVDRKLARAIDLQTVSVVDTTAPTVTAPPAKKAPAKGAAAKKPAGRQYLRRADLGAPADAFFAQQPPERREHLEALRALVKNAAPGARESMKWGMPCYELKGGFCALYTSNTYAALNIMAPPEKLDDPEGKLEGTGKTMRHLKVRSCSDSG